MSVILGTSVATSIPGVHVGVATSTSSVGYALKIGTAALLGVTLSVICFWFIAIPVLLAVRLLTALILYWNYVPTNVVLAVLGGNACWHPETGVFSKCSDLPERDRPKHPWALDVLVWAGGFNYYNGGIAPFRKKWYKANGDLIDVSKGNNNRRSVF